jgi:hypothetical protein
MSCIAHNMRLAGTLFQNLGPLFALLLSKGRSSIRAHPQNLRTTYLPTANSRQLQIRNKHELET